MRNKEIISAARVISSTYFRKWSIHQRGSTIPQNEQEIAHRTDELPIYNCDLSPGLVE
jgi:hypothetical protein